MNEFEAVRRISQELCGTIEIWKEKCQEWEKKLTKGSVRIEFEASKAATNSTQTSQHRSKYKFQLSMKQKNNIAEQ